MTNEKASVIIGNIPVYGDECYSIAEYQEAKTVAVQALSQEPTNENLHREREQAYMQGYEDASKRFRQEPCDDAVSRQAAIDAFERFIHELGIEDEPYNYGEMALSAKNVPPVTQKSGKWQVVSDGYGDSAYICECSECKDTVWVYKNADRKWNYCPNCGARMESEVEE